jgi:hypothetical protein
VVAALLQVSDPGTGKVGKQLGAGCTADAVTLLGAVQESDHRLCENRRQCGRGDRTRHLHRSPGGTKQRFQVAVHGQSRLGRVVTSTDKTESNVRVSLKNGGYCSGEVYDALSNFEPSDVGDERTASSCWDL